MAEAISRLALKVSVFSKKGVRELFQYMESCSTLLIDYQIVSTTLHSIFIVRVTGPEDQVEAFIVTCKGQFGDSITHVF